jgi:hypothetical protein
VIQNPAELCRSRTTMLDVQFSVYEKRTVAVTRDRASQRDVSSKDTPSSQDEPRSAGNGGRAPNVVGSGVVWFTDAEKLPFASLLLTVP